MRRPSGSGCASFILGKDIEIYVAPHDDTAFPNGGECMSARRLASKERKAGTGCKSHPGMPSALWGGCQGMKGRTGGGQRERAPGPHQPGFPAGEDSQSARNRSWLSEWILPMQIRWEGRSDNVSPEVPPPDLRNLRTSCVPGEIRSASVETKSALTEQNPGSMFAAGSGLNAMQETGNQHTHRNLRSCSCIIDLPQAYTEQIRQQTSPHLHFSSTHNQEVSSVSLTRNLGPLLQVPTTFIKQRGSRTGIRGPTLVSQRLV